MDLQDMKCQPCRGGIEPLKGQQIFEFLKMLSDGWKVVDEHHLERTFKLKDFQQALDLTNEIGRIAEQEGHHPDILLSWGKVKVTIWTHKIDGLHQNDFILASKIDRIGL